MVLRSVCTSKCCCKMTANSGESDAVYQRRQCWVVGGRDPLILGRGGRGGRRGGRGRVVKYYYILSCRLCQPCFLMNEDHHHLSVFGIL